MTPQSPIANDNQTIEGKPAFDYSAPAEMYIHRGLSVRGRPTGYRRFPTAAQAIRFAIEEVPEPLLVDTVMEVKEHRFDHNAIRELYQRREYPLSRAIGPGRLGHSCLS